LLEVRDWRLEIKKRKPKPAPFGKANPKGCGTQTVSSLNLWPTRLVKVLAIDSWICQGAALHGLGHLHHPSTAELVDRFVEEHPSLTKEQLSYAHAAARFEVL
jgi:hypothetical protein